MNSQLKEYYLSPYCKTVESVIFSLAGFSVMMIITRVILTARFTFMFLFWDLLLAFIPLSITSFLFHRIPIIENKFLFLVFVIGWIFFLPNAFYLLLDISYLKSADGVPQWYDLTLLLSIAFAGLIIGVLTIHRMAFFFQLVFPFVKKVLFILPVILLSASLAYLERFQRIIALEKLSEYSSQLNDLYAYILNPALYQSAGIRFSFFVIFLILAYRGFTRFIKALPTRKKC